MLDLLRWPGGSRRDQPWSHVSCGVGARNHDLRTAAFTLERRQGKAGSGDRAGRVRGQAQRYVPEQPQDRRHMWLVEATLLNNGGATGDGGGCDAACRARKRQRSGIRSYPWSGGACQGRRATKPHAKRFERMRATRGVQACIVGCLLRKVDSTSKQQQSIAVASSSQQLLPCLE